MAKTENVEGTVFAAARPTRVSMYLNEKSAKILDGLSAKPGMPIILTVRGVLIETVRRDDDDYSGSLDMEAREVKIARDHQNPVAEMFYQDEGPGEGAR